MLAYKLLISDVDGTLVDGKQKIPLVNKEAIKRLKEKGFYFSLATGRMFSSAHSFIKELEIDFPVILYNGAQIVESRTGKVIYEKKVDMDTVQKALSLYREFSLEALVYDKGDIYVEEINETIEEYMKKDQVQVHPVGDLSRFIDGEVTKLLLIGSEKKFRAFRARLEKILGRKVNLVQSEETYLEILPVGVSKGEALEVLATEYGLKLEEIVAIGDNPNDLEMVKRAGLGAVPCNAHPQLISAADYITRKSNSEGAVAELIYEFFI